MKDFALFLYQFLKLPAEMYAYHNVNAVFLTAIQSKFLNGSKNIFILF